MAAEQSMVKVIDHLSSVLSNKFSRDVSRIYFGDIGTYLPSAFGSSRRDQKAIIALSPAYNHLMEGERVAAHESRLLGITIITMVNITPFFEADPKEALGERMLVTLTTEIADFLTQEENVTLGNRVLWSSVNDIDWAWVGRNEQAIRASGINYEARVRIPRM